MTVTPITPSSGESNTTDVEVYRHTPVISSEEVEIVKNMYCKGATDAEFKMFMATCERTGLSPIMRQIFAVKRREKDDVTDQWRDALSVQVSIDGFRLIADRTKKYRGRLSVEWCGKDGRWTDVWLEPGPPAAARVSVLRSDFAQPLTAVARYDSYVQTKRNGDPNRMWQTMPDHMLAKCAEALALRTAFPAELSGLYTDDEFEAEPFVETTAHAVPVTETIPAAGSEPTPVDLLLAEAAPLNEQGQRQLKKWWLDSKMPKGDSWPRATFQALVEVDDDGDLVPAVYAAISAIRNGERPTPLADPDPDEPDSASSPTTTAPDAGGSDDDVVDAEVVEDGPGVSNEGAAEFDRPSSPQGATVASQAQAPAPPVNPPGGGTWFDVLKAQYRELGISPPDRIKWARKLYPELKKITDLTVEQASIFSLFIDNEVSKAAQAESKVHEAFPGAEEEPATEGPWA